MAFRGCNSFRQVSLQARQLSTPKHRSPIAKHSYIDEEFLSLVSKEHIAEHMNDLGAFPSFSNILTPQHFYQNEVLLKYSQKLPHPVSLRQLAGYGKKLTKQKVLASANFVRLELPIRLAMRIRDLQTLPFGVVNNFHLAQIYESYYHLFNAFRKIGTINSLSENDEFCKVISALLDQHVFNLSHLMMGALELSILENLPQHELDLFMSSMLRSRISRRVIVEEHLSLTEIHKKHPYQENPPDYIGEIFQNCNAREQFEKVGKLVLESMLGYFPDQSKMPGLVIEGDVDASFQFMVPHLHYLFGEILRNSFEATINTHGKVSSGKLPPIKITIIDSKKQIVFRISDRGGGISHSKLESMWSFGKLPELARKSLKNFHRIPGLQMYSNLQVTAAGSSIVEAQNGLDQTSVADVEQISTKTKKSTLEQLTTRQYKYKLGLGLPMCKVYADYWNGNLTMNSLEGYGSDTCLTLSKLGFHTNVIQLDRA
ncbi:alpha-ketoacid dehydrogenase kinase [Metschnikowia bicuspidata var. bicuspidata NRRL YB-4993]|uniref:Protein-serine/threonine kinase n=1 Tax=Metschnikowia bicuspidata var. bicuspidata NRRL YB-4993 TaxID=869754 RepID=A0A1A0HFS7_9ASCO|nr:alpha-ketoacid dehydrogenase kinase [Metschnikowia bicuspidata var. bicuspidata NRRL YB-4993]OBA22840.1 alpha-ketoacid dehydrogenase kinase [Metschnikowia bicuspidata var. bicuspidata NRRL YB-4993]